MIPVPEMEAFADRFGFRFVAHQIGNANRSARVERAFSFIENNFLAFLASRVDAVALKPLPAWIPEVYRLHQRTLLSKIAS